MEGEQSTGRKEKKMLFSKQNNLCSQNNPSGYLSCFLCPVLLLFTLTYWVLIHKFLLCALYSK